ncbi:TetR family transcriptional regulator [Murinocardiopsis flavida]|uniref:TetR family transcriptional regulator n=1 Tax=Murinocardiopsis flavida TaxID=645275 RepID=A0A2P8DH95_9ACTN|nr:TetR family transcriptional regulator [Murinocardiopsis flavida]PSK96573.1 TetR family transcriptional regulator [Murinocardiopsis flavida]
MTRPAVAEPQGGLRERKKAMTREALIDSALRLFDQHGFAATTTEQIAASVGVSQRTFFRYFATKEEVVSAAHNAVDDDFFARFLAKDPAIHPLEALRAAAVETWQSLDERALRSQVLLSKLYDSTPQLLACRLRNGAQYESRIVAVITSRTGIDPVTDLRPRLVAAAFGATMHAAVCYWMNCGTDGVHGAVRTIERHFDALGPALTGPWHDRPGATAPPS